MKTGKSLAELAAELERQEQSRRDFVAPAPALSMEPAFNSPDRARLNVGADSMPLTNHAHGQLAEYLDIPRRYYNRMLERAPDLLAENVNAWLQSDPGGKRMIRTLDGRVRGVLSERFRTLDNLPLARTVLPVLSQLGCQVVSSELTERRFYVKAILPALCRDIQEGLVLGEGHNFARTDMLIASLQISNSEVGAGSLRVEAGFYKTRCSNLAVFDGSALKRYHVGRVWDVDEDVRELLSDDTRVRDDEVFFLKVRDVVQGAFNRDIFNARVDRLQEAAGRRIESKDIPRVVEVTRRRFGIAEGLQNDILRHLIEGGDLTQWGLLNAVTRTAEDIADYDEASELERIGGRIIELAPSEWQAIAA